MSSLGPGDGVVRVTGAPLTEDEQALLNRLLGDPTYFPLTFKLWLKDYIESGDIRIGRSQVRGLKDGTGTAGATNLPAGVMLPIGGTTIPSDCLACDGGTYDVAEYPELYDVIGTNYGGTPGSTFKVPNLGNKALYGMGVIGGQFGATTTGPTGAGMGANYVITTGK